MSDHRLDQLEEEISSLNAGQQSMQQEMKAMQERLMKHTEDMIMVLSNQIQEKSILNSGGGHDESSSYNRKKGKGITGSSSITTPKITKLDFPRYNGREDPTEWICRVEQFFEFQHTEEEDKMPMAGYHLEGDVQLWYQRFRQEVGADWESLKIELHQRYGPSRYQNFFGDLTKLRQQGSVREYQQEFDRLLHRTGQLSNEQQVGCFVSGLKEAIRADVQAAGPVTLSGAIGLARLYESKLQEVQKGKTQDFKKFPALSSLPPLPPPTGSRGRNPVIKRLSPAELKDRRDRGLCFNCDEKFAPGHRCKKLFLIEGIFPTIEEEEQELEPQEESQEIPEISFHAITGMAAPRTMRLKGNFGSFILTILIDTGSTHNFLNSDVAAEIGIQPKKKGSFEVVVTDGNKMCSGGLCEDIPLTIQGVEFVTEFYLLPVEGCDAVLGVQWLKELGPVIWESNEMWMKFFWKGKTVELCGAKGPKNRIYGEQDLRKEIRKGKRAYLLQLNAIHLGIDQQREEPIEPEFQRLIDTYSGIFKEPTALPPRRQQDHHIILKEGAGPVNVKPYRYPHFQKLKLRRWSKIC